MLMVPEKGPERTHTVGIIATFALHVVETLLYTVQAFNMLFKLIDGFVSMAVWSVIKVVGLDVQEMAACFQHAFYVA